MPEISGINVPFIPAGGVNGYSSPPVSAQSPSKVSFQDVFTNELTKVKFSGHAQTRMNSRDIKIDEADMLRLEDAVTKAADKGANEALVLLDDKAFIVSVPNKTVITMINKDQLEDSVITKIDSAVFA